MKPFERAENGLLAALPADERGRLDRQITRVTCDAGAALLDSGRGVDYVYFPITCVVALLYTMEDGSTSEMAIVGNEGIVGIAAFLGGEAIPGRAVVQSSGTAARLSAPALREVFRRGGAFQRLLLRYTQALVVQVSQMGVCRGVHSVEQRLNLWLLMTHDRLGCGELPLTQEALATMLGVRRESVNHAARHLQDAGCIRYSRGHIRILDRRPLELGVCECYRVITDEFDRLLGPKFAARDGGPVAQPDPRVTVALRPRQRR
jgi:CRP-like cAMP-binding protein